MDIWQGNPPVFDARDIRRCRDIEVDLKDGYSRMATIARKVGDPQFNAWALILERIARESDATYEKLNKLAQEMDGAALGVLKEIADNPGKANRKFRENIPPSHRRDMTKGR